MALGHALDQHGIQGKKSRGILKGSRVLVPEEGHRDANQGGLRCGLLSLCERGGRSQAEYGLCRDGLRAVLGVESKDGKSPTEKRGHSKTIWNETGGRGHDMSFAIWSWLGPRWTSTRQRGRVWVDFFLG